MEVRVHCEKFYLILSTLFNLFNIGTIHLTNPVALTSDKFEDYLGKPINQQHGWLLLIVLCLKHM